MTNPTQTTFLRLLNSYPKTLTQMLPWLSASLILTLSFLLVSCDRTMVTPEPEQPAHQVIPTAEDQGFPRKATEQELATRYRYLFNGAFYSGRTEQENGTRDRARIFLNIRQLATRLTDRNGTYRIVVRLHPTLVASGRVNAFMPNPPANLNFGIQFPPDYANVFILGFDADPANIPAVLNGLVVIDLDNQGTPLPALAELVEEVSENGMCCAGSITVVMDDLMTQDME